MIDARIQSADNNLLRLCGVVEQITFHSETNGFCVIRVKCQGQRDLVTLVGTAARIHSGEQVEAHGMWQQDPQFGLQFRASSLRLIPPNTPEGMEKYLGSGLIKGVGPQFAQRLLAAFGAEVFNIIDNQPERLREVPGIGKKRLSQILTSWRDQKMVRNIMVFLHSHGMGTSRALRIFKTYGDNAIEIVRENPYRLAEDIWGIGFKTADELAHQLGIDPHSPLRAAAGLSHVLLHHTEQGHCTMLRTDLVDTSVALLHIPAHIVSKALDTQLQRQKLHSELIEDRHFIYLPHLYTAEAGVAELLNQLREGVLPWGFIDPAKAIAWAENKTQLSLSPSQHQAVAMALNHKICVITGGPGVGKTTVLNTLLKIIAAKNISLKLCAPTGRAAKRMAESTGFPATTIHRLLEYLPQSRCFRHQREYPLTTELVVVDETSMLDIQLAYALFQAIPKTSALILVGDGDQLPSVGPGAVLTDIIQAQTIVTVRLTEIFRQASQSRIITNAHRIHQGLAPMDENHAEQDFFIISADEPENLQHKLLQVVCERIPKRFGFNPQRDIQIITPMNRGILGAWELNRVFQQRLNPQASSVEKFGTRYGIGDKVIQRVNNYDKDVYNGDLGLIHHIEPETQQVTISMDERLVVYAFHELDELALAYAITVHKSQGSEYPAVVIPLAMQHYNLLDRHLLYTAITRGKKLVVLLVQPKALHLAVKKHHAAQRQTFLKYRLQGS